MIQTVLGPIDGSELGVTLPHEHFYCGSVAANLAEPDDLRDRELARQPHSLENRNWIEFHWHMVPHNLVLDDPVTALEEINYYRRAGGRSVIDVTPWGIGRQPRALAEISRKSGLHVVMGCGYYWQAMHPPEVATMSQGQITEKILREFAEGAEGTGIKPGLIGEVGCSWPLTPDEEKSLRASAAAQAKLGTAFQIHPGKHPDSPPQILKIVAEEGADLRRVIICHIERTIPDMPRILDVVRTGATVEYDLFGMETTGLYYRELGITIPSDAQRLDQIRQLIDAGFGRQVLMSHDICFKHWLRKYGGRGYDHILTNTIPWMRQRGFTEAEITMLTVDNPRRLFART